MSAIRARGLRFGYGRGREVIRGVDLDLAAGDLLAIFGPNGAGKSTLLRLLAGELAPSQGVVELDGRPVRAYGRRALARLVAVVHQETEVAFPFTVAEVVLMGRAPYVGRFSLEAEADLAAARKALGALDLEALADRPIGEISGGERQRAAIARAIAQSTPVLLLDEPTAFLDPRHQVDVLRLARRLAAEGRAIAIVSHEVNLAAQYASRIVLMKDGAVRASGPPEEVIRPEIVREVFETEVALGRHPRTERPYMLFGGD